MTRKLRLSAVGLCALITALVCSGGLARATVDFLEFNHRAVRSPDRTMATVTGSVECTAGHDLSLIVHFHGIQGGTHVFGDGNGNVDCTGFLQNYSVDVSVTYPSGGEFKNGQIPIYIHAFDDKDGDDLVETGKVVISGPNNQ